MSKLYPNKTESKCFQSICVCIKSISISHLSCRFPLYCRSIPPPESFLYAVFLLNQNIAQLKFMLGLNGQRDDVRATLPNLMAILNSVEPSTASLRKTESTKASASEPKLIGSSTEDSPVTLASVSNSSIDLNTPVPVPQRIPVHGTHSYSDSELNLTDIRYSEFLFIF